MNLPLPRWQSLQTRVTLLSLVIFVFGLAALAFYSSRMLRDNIQQRLSEQQFATVSILAAQIDQAISERMAVLQAVATAIDPTMLDQTARLQAHLVQRSTFQTMFNAGTFVVRRDGLTVASLPIDAAPIGINYSDRPGIASAMELDKTVISKPVRSRLLNTPAFTITAPLHDAQGRVTGALVGVTDLGKPNFLDKITNASYGKSGGYLLVSPRDKLVVTATIKSLVMTDSASADPLVARFMQGYEGSGIMINPIGVEVLASARGIPAAGWFLAVALPLEEVFAPIVGTRQSILIATMVLTLFTSFMIWWMLRKQLAPLTDTAKALTLLSQTGEAPPPFPITRRDEVGDLLGGFNRLLATLAEQDRELRKSDRRFRAIVDASPVPLLINDANRNVTYVNQAFTQTLGYTLEDIPNLEAWWPKAYPEEAYRRQVIDAWQVRREQAQRDKNPVVRMDVDITCKDGQVRNFTSTWSALEQEFFGTRLVTLFDNTERWQRVDTQAKLAAIVESSNDAILSRSLDGTILSWNEGARKMLGYEADEVIGKPASITFPPNHRSHRDANNAMVTSGEIFRRESQRRAKDGRIVDVLSSHSAIRDHAGNIVGVSIILQDISARKRAEAERAELEEQLRESQKMQAVGTLAGGIAHDFNNIIAAILGNAELAFEDAGANPRAARESIDEIRKAGRRARELVQQILAFSRRQPTELKLIYLAPIIEESARLLRSTMPARISLDVQCAADLPAVMADATQIQQILLNLATNAMQAIGALPGRIRIALEAITTEEAPTEDQPALRALCERHPGPLLRLTVTDTGPGMDRAMQEHIFEPFFTTKPVGEGTGLGLSVVHGIVQSHQGAITVRSQRGAGATFAIYLPPAAQDLQTPAANAIAGGAAPLRRQNEGGHVLYLDDDQFLVNLVKRLLERKGFKVSAFQDQAEALAALRADPDAFDLVVSDYNMPGMSGLDVAREVRCIRANLPMAVVSGFVDETLQAEAIDAGVREVIFKAAAMDGFTEVIQRLIEEVRQAEKHG